MLDENQLKRLPLYARQEIERLTMNCDFYKGKLNEALGKSINHDAEVHCGAEINGRLPVGSRVRYVFPKGYVELYRSKNGPYVEVRSERAIAVSPVASNVVTVEPLNFHDLKRGGA